MVQTQFYRELSKYLIVRERCADDSRKRTEAFASFIAASLTDADERIKRRNRNLSTLKLMGGADRDRTGDPRLAKPVLSQLSYSPLG
jgi:hypothetical protein